MLSNKRAEFEWQEDRKLCVFNSDWNISGSKVFSRICTKKTTLKTILLYYGHTTMLVLFVKMQQGPHTLLKSFNRTQNLMTFFFTSTDFKTNIPPNKKRKTPEPIHENPQDPLRGKGRLCPSLAPRRIFYSAASRWRERWTPRILPPAEQVKSPSEVYRSWQGNWLRREHRKSSRW